MRARALLNRARSSCTVSACCCCSVDDVVCSVDIWAGEVNVKNGAALIFVCASSNRVVESRRRMVEVTLQHRDAH